MNWKLHAARWALGELRDEDLPGIATDALCEGAESAALAQLAGHTRVSVTEPGVLFARVLSEAGVEIPSRRAATHTLIQHVATEIVRGAVLPDDGAKRLVRLAYEFDPIPPELMVFIALESEIEDFGDVMRLNYYGAEHCAKVQAEDRHKVVEAARALASSSIAARS